MEHRNLFLQFEVETAGLHFMLYLIYQGRFAQFAQGSSAQVFFKVG